MVGGVVSPVSVTAMVIDASAPLPEVSVACASTASELPATAFAGTSAVAS